MTARRIILLRHATAGSFGSGADHDRRLTGEGRAEAARVGARLEALGWVPTKIVSSTAQRCKETAAAVCSGLNETPPTSFDDALYNAEPDAIAEVIAAQEGATSSAASPATHSTLLILAHNPGISVLAFEFGSGDEEAESILRAGFAPASFAAFEIADDDAPVSRRNATLRHFEHPS